MAVHMTWKRCIEQFCLGAIIAGAVTSHASSDTITVDDDGPADFDNIQAAIFAASDGDTVLILPGLYSNVFVDSIFNTNGKKIHIRSSGGASVTFVDGRNQYRCIECDSGEDSETIIEGLTVTNGFAPFGSGIYLSNSSPTIRNCIFTDNDAQFYGGSILCQTAHPAIEGCTFSGNMAGAWGAGIYAMYDSNPEISDSNFVDNIAVENGGAIASGSQSHTTVTNCVFSSNSSATGGAIYNVLSDCTVENCNFAGNAATVEGCAIAARESSSISISDSSFSGNTSSEGGALACVSSVMEIEDSDFLNNTANLHGGCAIAHENSTVSFENSTLFVNTSSVGGAMFGESSFFWITDSEIRGNSASAGGAVNNLTGQTYVTNSLICDNAPDQIAGPFEETNSCITRWCDTDNDGVPGCYDGCPEDPEKTDPEQCGCGNPETDTDQDGTADCVDECPNDPNKSVAGACGCGTPETDSDGDMLPDCLDDCPYDPDKTSPGICGCGTSDVDSDGDGTSDCDDSCPTWPGDCSDDGMTLLVDQGRSISSAIDVATDGTTILVEAGTWNESIDFSGKAITIASSSYHGAEDTILDGTGLGTSIVIFENGEGPDSVLRGFTLRNGTDGTIFIEPTGGALFTLDSSPTIEQCLFTGNRADYGGAAFLRGGAPTLRDCTFTSNHAWTDGGAICMSFSDALVDNCICEGNTADHDGAGINMISGTPVIRNTTIRNNIAEGNGAGAIWSSFGGFAIIRECIIESNRSMQGDGGGLLIPNDDLDVILYDTSICYNKPKNVIGEFTDLGGNSVCNCPPDLDEDGFVDGSDLSMLLSHWGACTSNHCPGDLDDNGIVDGADLGIFLGHWGTCD
jgi:hypothetical protein